MQKALEESHDLFKMKIKFENNSDKNCSNSECNTMYLHTLISVISGLNINL